MLAPVGFLPPDDPRIIGTVTAIQKDLVDEGFVRRYKLDGSVDGLEGREGTFLMTTFWLADNLALMGRSDEAREIFEHLRGLSNDVGLLSEEYDPSTGRMLGNFPQAFSHVSLINTAANLSTPAGPSMMRSGRAAPRRRQLEEPNRWAHSLYERRNLAKVPDRECAHILLLNRAISKLCTCRAGSSLVSCSKSLRHQRSISGLSVPQGHRG